MSDDLERLWSRYAHVWGWITIALLVGVSLFLTFAGEFLHLHGSSGAYLKAIGGSLLASVVFYSLISLFLEPKQRALQAMQVSEFAIEVANRQFHDRFQISLPEAVFRDSDVPKSDFRDAFIELLSNSSRYDFKGASAIFTVFRLVTLRGHPELRRLEEVRLCLADPRDETVMRSHAKRINEVTRRGGEARTTEERVELIKLDIAVSLVALFDIRIDRPAVVYLHRDLPFFRCEAFDGGIFLSYYVGRAPYPETLQFSPTTRPFLAYREGLEITRTFASGILSFSDASPSADTVNSEDALREWLMRLGLEADLNTLRTQAERRFQVLGSQLAQERLSPGALF